MNGFLNPTEILNQLSLRDDMIVADFGSGSGGWAIPLAKRLKTGRVYAIDILEEPLSALKSKAQIERISNIETILSNIENKNGSKLPDESCNLVLITNLLFEVKDKKAVLEEEKRILRPGGEILIVDWTPPTHYPENSPFGPQEGKASTEEVKKIAKDLNLKNKKEFDASIYHWGLILVKPGSENLAACGKITPPSKPYVIPTENNKV